MPSSQTDPLPRGQTLHLRAPVPINTDALPPAHRPSSSPSPSPTRGLELSSPSQAMEVPPPSDFAKGGGKGGDQSRRSRSAGCQPASQGD